MGKLIIIYLLIGSYLMFSIGYMMGIDSAKHLNSHKLIQECSN